MKRIIIFGMILGLILGFGSVGFTEQPQESEEIIKVPGASEGFIDEEAKKYWSAEEERLAMDFFHLTFDIFKEMLKELTSNFIVDAMNRTVRGVVSNRPAILLYDFRISIYEDEEWKKIKSDLIFFYYVDDLQKTINIRKPFVYEYKHLLFPEAKETARKFVDSIKEKMKK